MSALQDILNTQWRMLTLRNVRPALDRFGAQYLLYCFLIAIVVGAGRYWDNPRAFLLQKMGLGSAVYIVLLAAFFWLILMPLRPNHWTYRNVLVFVGLTALPGLLYAVPVERFMTMGGAQSANAWFLFIVASWRVLMLVAYLHGSAGLKGWEILTAMLLPLALIVAFLAALNLEQAAFSIMAGIPEEQRTPDDTSYFVVVMITYLSFLASPILIGCYIGVLVSRRKRLKEEARRDEQPPSEDIADLP